MTLETLESRRVARNNLNEQHADMAELVDALASGASVLRDVEVQVLLSAPHLVQ